MPKYTIKKGYEHVVISQEGVRRIDASTVESDHELNSAILTLIPEVAPAPATVTSPVTGTPAETPATPSQPVNPPPTQTQEGAK
jgi:hypothetical protein